MGCEPSRVLHGRVPYNVLDLKMGIPPQNHQALVLRLLNKSMSKPKWFSKMYAKMQCKPTSNTKTTTTNRQMLLNSANAITSVFDKYKQIIKSFKVSSQISAGFGRTSFKKLFQITNNWYAKTDRIQRNSFTACDYNRSSYENPYPTYRVELWPRSYH